MMDGEESSAQGPSTPTPPALTPPAILLHQDEESQTAHDGNAAMADHSRADHEVTGGHEAQPLATTDTSAHLAPSASSDGNAALALMEFLEEDRLLRNRADEGQEITTSQVDVSSTSDADSSRPPVPPREHSSESPDRRGNTNVESVEIDGARSPINSQSNVPTTVTPNGQLSVAGPSLRRGDSESRRTEIVRARWQPDGEVTYCPICHIQFGWVVRKHHCRKCGRVVCGSCSTHRITIPYEYIARPPSEGLRAYGFSASDELALERSRTGGERVRLCNPCVPDPNVAPPQVPSHDSLYRSGSERRSYRSSSSTTSASSNAPRRDHRSSLVFDNYSRHLRVPSILQPEDSGQEGNRSRSNTMPARDAGGLHSGSSNHTRSESSYISQRGQYPRTVDNSRPLPQLPPPSEDDICPVCHRLLTARTVPNYEELRAAHIISCIEGHSVNHSSQIRPGAYTSRSDPAEPIQAGSSSNPEGSRTQRRWVPSNGSSSSSSRPFPNTPEARMAAREQAHAAVVLGSSRTPPAESGRQTRLFPYKATEKDCVDDAECTICLEEFEVGADMARLECFCRFHLHCIRDWWVEHHGRCPVHQHDGYGF